MTQTGSDWGGSRDTTFQTCHKKYYWAYRHNKTGLVSVHGGDSATFGTLVHVGLQCFYKSASSPLTYSARAVHSIKCAVDALHEDTIDEAKRPLMQDELIACLDQYFSYYETRDTMKVLEVETETTIRVGDFIHTGIIDLFAQHDTYEVVVDHKSTTLNWDLFFKKWKFDLSLRGYVYAKRKQLGRPVHVLVNGIRRKRNKALECEFQREPIFFTDDDMLEFERTIQCVRDEIHQCDVNGFWPRNGSQCVQPWGACEFRRLCDYPDESMVKTFYKQRGGEENDPSNCTQD